MLNSTVSNVQKDWISKLQQAKCYLTRTQWRRLREMTLYIIYFRFFTEGGNAHYIALRRVFTRLNFYRIQALFKRVPVS